MKRLFSGALVALVAAWTASLVAQAGAGPDIAGYYNEKDGEYTKISKIADGYQYLQHGKTGDWVGVAIREGDRLSIGWQRADGRNLGVSSYRIERGPQGPVLVGGWAAYPDGRMARDTAGSGGRGEELRR